MQWYLIVLKKYAVFSGRAQRSEYWYFVLFNFLIAVFLSVVGLVLATIVPSLEGGWLVLLYSLAMFLPSLGVTVRRLHDTGRSGWWLLVGLVPFVGVFVIFYFMLCDSEAGDNRFGPNPKNTYA